MMVLIKGTDAVADEGQTSNKSLANMERASDSKEDRWSVHILRTIA